jgi:ABC-type sugar transport system substrate-binding protein
MKKKTTLHDIAIRAHVSVGTVHKALCNQPGVSAEKKIEILEIAKNLRYSTSKKNENFSSGKTIAVLFPYPENDDRLFYQYIWSGINTKEEEISPYYLHIRKFSFDGTKESQLQQMQMILRQYGDEIECLVTIVWVEDLYLDLLQRYSDKGIKIITVSSDAPTSNRLATVMPSPYRIGRLAAEFLGSIIKRPGRIVILGTRRDSLNHAHIVRGFFDQMSITNPTVQIMELYESVTQPERVFESLEKLLSAFDDVVGIYANNARTTKRLCDYARTQQRDKELKIVGSEVFDESLVAMREGLLEAIIDQNPFMQGYKAIELAFEHLILQQDIPAKNTVQTSLFLLNNLPLEAPEIKRSETIPLPDSL